MKIYKYLNPPVENFIISTILISGGLFRIFEKCTMVEIMYKYYTVIQVYTYVIITNLADEVYIGKSFIVAIKNFTRTIRTVLNSDYDLF